LKHFNRDDTLPVKPAAGRPAPGVIEITPVSVWKRLWERSESFKAKATATCAAPRSSSDGT